MRCDTRGASKPSVSYVVGSSRALFVLNLSCVLVRRCFDLSATSCCKLDGIGSHFSFWSFCCCGWLQRSSFCCGALLLACAAFCNYVISPFVGGDVGGAGNAGLFWCFRDVGVGDLAQLSSSALLAVHSVCAALCLLPSAAALVAASFCGASALPVASVVAGVASLCSLSPVVVGCSCGALSAC